METPLHKNEQVNYQIPAEFSSRVGEITKIFSRFVTESRLNGFHKVLDARSRQTSIYLESTKHCHNISAVMRTADAFGYQDMTFMYHEKLTQSFRQKDNVERGSSNWLTLRRAKSVQQCVDTIKSEGRRLFLVALPSFEDSGKNYNTNAKSFLLDEKMQKKDWDFIFEKPVAVVFGNEGLGLSQEWHQNADGYLQVPMRGFVESLNLSVTAGIILHTLQIKMHETGHKINSTLSPLDKQLLLDLWTLRSCENTEVILQREAQHLLDYSRFLSAGAFSTLS